MPEWKGLGLACVLTVEPTGFAESRVEDDMRAFCLPFMKPGRLEAQVVSSGVGFEAG